MLTNLSQLPPPPYAAFAKGSIVSRTVRMASRLLATGPLWVPRRGVASVPAPAGGAITLSPSRFSPHILRHRSEAPPSAKAAVIATGYGPSAAYVVVDHEAFATLLKEALSVRTVAEDAALRGCAPCSTDSYDTTLAGDHTVRELLRIRQETEAALAPLQLVHEAAHRHAWHVFYPFLKYGCFAILAAQLLVYAHWTFVVFDWNLVEPTTYFLGYSGVFGGLVLQYLRCGHSTAAVPEFTWRNLFVWLSENRASRLCAKRGIDEEEMRVLRRRLHAIQVALARYKVRSPSPTAA